MLKRFFKLIFILFAVSTLSFWICNHTNTDPIEQWCMLQHNENEGFDCIYSEEAALKRKEWGLDLPLFYVEISTWAEPDTLYKITDKKKQKAALIWLQHCGDWQKVQNYLIASDALSKEFQYIINQHLTDSNYFEYTHIQREIHALSLETDSLELSQISAFPSLPSPSLPLFSQSANAMFKPKFNIKNYMPKISFFGFDNQYHQWLIQVLQGNWGKSYRTNQAVSDRIWDFVGRSAMFALLSFVLAYMIAIPLGVLKTAYHHSFLDKATDAFIFIINALPSFAIGIFLIVFFANPDIFDWFSPTYNSKGTWFERATLPLIAYTIGSATYLTTFIQSLLLAEMQQDYIRTARAKGLCENFIYLRHAFKNILVPLLTSSAGLLPSLIGGSLALEYVFSIGGMGEEALAAIQNVDIPMILAIMTITGLLTVVGYMITDIFSYIIDRRMSKE